MQWMPIENAPEEGQFLVYMPDDQRQPIQVAKWHPNVKVIGNVFAFDSHKPTHWMPLPQPPNDQAKRAAESGSGLGAELDHKG